MGMRIDGGGYYTDTACFQPDETLPSAPSSVEVVEPECGRAILEEGIAHAGCVGTALWTAGSLPSLLGAVGGAIATVAACSYAVLKSSDVEDACKTEQGPPNPDLMWSLDAM